MSTNITQPLPRSFHVISAARLHCPRCDQGKLFSGWFRMNKECDKCGLTFEREPGFYLASIYFNYGATALVSGIAFTVLALVFGYPQEVVLAVCLGFTIAFPLWFFRYARSIFLAIDYYIHPESEQVRTAPKAASVVDIVVPVRSVERTQDQASSLPQNTTAAFTAVRSPSPTASLSDAELATLRADDATAGMVVTLVVTLALLFGLTMSIVATYASLAMPYQG